ncbi:hydantoinase/oxoprolinase family protein [Methylobrevis albus]|uniref:Hydantoinase/oxoprolinase family protein n=1 Tax=Methylobrevis albus TaxID=2793297 RepID=A0A931I3U6_9HYPH|nr:hydantoinase/oxoprolinase family protein [Methylobrevis albus]MBH0238756.1 hydantoinase/oxoprolinase family protein [Methylobrevis albus]
MTRIATDAGGTFTDLVAFDELTGAIQVGKALTTPRDPSIGVVDAIAQAEEEGLATAEATLFVHGGTTVINAITERKGVATALVTTRGFRDVIAIGRGNRPDLYNLHSEPAQPFVPRHLRFEVTERMDARGEVRIALDHDDLAAVADRIAASGVAAVAILFLHSYVNPEHEQAAARFLRERLPGVAVAASHEVSRQWREYERSNTAVLSAYVQPIMARYLSNLADALGGRGIDCPAYCMQSSGGLASFPSAVAAPLVLVESGPAGGVAGAARVGEALGEPDILYLDVGGTTAKCSLVSGGRPVLKPDYKLEWSRLKPGYPVQIPVVDIVEIGAGGGSIAWIDPAGAVQVGPESAGSDPGPACYGRGGTRPTVTDAKLLTGVIDAEGFAGGRIQLDVAAAERAFGPIAAHLGVDVVAAAEAVIRLAEANMINALKLVTIQRGHDPRDLTMVVSGGGGPMHAATLGRELGVRRTVIPRYAGLFSAWGMLTARPRIDMSRTRLIALGPDAMPRVQAVFLELACEAATAFGVAAEALIADRTIEMRYRGQEHAVATPYAPGESLAALLESFHAAHEKAYTFRLDDTPVELVTFHLAAELETPRVGLPDISAETTLAEAACGNRPLIGADGRLAPAPVYTRDLLPPGAEIAGPALIEEATTTTLVLAGQTARIDRYGLISIAEIPSAENPGTERDDREAAG